MSFKAESLKALAQGNALCDRIETDQALKGRKIMPFQGLVQFLVLTSRALPYSIAYALLGLN